MHPNFRIVVLDTFRVYNIFIVKQLTELRSVLARKPERLERLAAVRDPQVVSAARGLTLGSYQALFWGCRLT